MRLLLDTHVFIWWADQQESLSATALSAMKDEANELVLECRQCLGNADQGSAREIETQQAAQRVKLRAR